MVNTEKAIKRDRIRLRRGQNSRQIDFKRMRKARIAGTEYWRLKKKIERVSEEEVSEKKDTKKEKAKKKEPELEVIDEELEEIYSDDEDIELDDEKLDDAEPE